MQCALPFHAARRGHFIPRRDHRTDDTPVELTPATTRRFTQGVSRPVALILPGTDVKAPALNGSRVGGLTAPRLVRAESGLGALLRRDAWRSATGSCRWCTRSAYRRRRPRNWRRPYQSAGTDAVSQSISPPRAPIGGKARLPGEGSTTLGGQLADGRDRAGSGGAGTLFVLVGCLAEPGVAGSGCGTGGTWRGAGRVGRRRG